MRKKRKPEEHGFNVWRSYSDMMAGVLLLFVLIMCVTLFQAQKSYQDSLKERDEKIALQEKYTEELLEKQNALDEQAGTLKSQDEQIKSKDKQIKSQDEELSSLAEKLAKQQETLEAFIRLPRCGRLGKMGLIVKYGFTKNTLARTLGQMLFIKD